MFGVSFQELVILGAIALLVLGPQKLPSMLRTLGQWIGKLRRLTTEVREQSGIDDALRAEGLHGGLNELRSVMRGGLRMPSMSSVVPRNPVNRGAQPSTTYQPFAPDRSREYPLEGPDCYDALPEDLLPEARQKAAERRSESADETDSPAPPDAPEPEPAPARPDDEKSGQASSRPEAPAAERKSSPAGVPRPRPSTPAPDQDDKP